MQDAYLTFAGTVEVARVTIAMANLALAQNDHETALNTLRQIQADHPYYITARQHMANIYLYHRKEKKLYTACYRYCEIQSVFRFVSDFKFFLNVLRIHVLRNTNCM